MGRQLPWFRTFFRQDSGPPAPGTPPAAPPPAPPAAEDRGRDSRSGRSREDRDDDDYRFPALPSDRDRHGRGRPDITEQARRQLEAAGQDAVLALVGVLQQNFDLRDERRELNDENRRLRPQPGEVRLTREQAQQWQAYGALRLTPDQVHELVQRDQTRAAEDAKRENDERVDQSAALLGFARPKLLRRLVREDGLEVEIRSVTRTKADGTGKETVSVPYVKKAGQQGATPEPMADYHAAHWEEDFGDVLRTEPEGTAGSGQERQDRQDAPPLRESAAPAPTLIPLPSQGASGRARAADVVGTNLKNRYPLPKSVAGDRESNGRA